MLTFATLWCKLADYIFFFRKFGHVLQIVPWEADKLVFLLFYQKTGLDISCILTPMETLCMKCQNIFSGKKEKTINVSSNDFAHRLVKIDKNTPSQVTEDLYESRSLAQISSEYTIFILNIKIY